MAQHYFSFEREKGGDWPAAIKQAEAGSGWYADKSRVISITASPALTIAKDADNVWLPLRLPVYASNIEMLAKVRRGANETYYNFNVGAAVFFRSGLEGSPLNDSYYVPIGSVGVDSHARRISLFRRTGGGAQTNLTASTINALTSYPNLSDRIKRPVMIRARASGNILSGRAWYADESEPENWHFSLTRPNNEESGTGCGILCYGYCSVTEWSFVGVGTDGDPAPSAPPALLPISGKANINTTGGAPVSRVLIIYAASNETYTTAIPDSSGAWSANVPPGDYYVAYVSPGCQPIIHGPYNVSAE